MTDEEFNRYRLQSAHEFATALVAASQASADDAEERARAETDELLPDGGHSPGMLLLAAEADGTVVGSLWLGERPPKHVGTAWVYDLLVLPAHRGRGYGRAMMLAAEQLLLAPRSIPDRIERLSRQRCRTSALLPARLRRDEPADDQAAVVVESPRPPSPAASRS